MARLLLATLFAVLPFQQVVAQSVEAVPNGANVLEGAFSFGEPFVTIEVEYPEKAILQEPVAPKAALLEEIPAGQIWFKTNVRVDRKEKEAWCTPAVVNFGFIGRVQHALCAFDIERRSAKYGVATQQADYFPSVLQTDSVFRAPSPVLKQDDSAKLPTLMIITTVTGIDASTVSLEISFFGEGERVFIGSSRVALASDGWALFTPRASSATPTPYRVRATTDGSADYEVELIRD